MAGRARYPLEAVRTLRADEEAVARDALATRLRAQRDAELAVAQASASAATHREETAHVERGERAADRAGRPIAETLLAGDWLRRRRAEADMLARAVSGAVREHAEATSASERARSTLADARAAREAVEKHHATWLAGERRAEEARAEAEAEDAMAGRRR